MHQPFPPTPNSTVNIDVSASNQRVIITADAANSIRVMNNGTATVWIDFGTVAVTAALTTSMPVGPGPTEVLRFQNKDGSRLYAAAIAAGATGKIYFTPGNGV